MSLFSTEVIARKTKARSIDIEESFYIALGTLARKYNTSINKLVNIAVDEMLKIKKVQIYQSQANTSMISRSYEFKNQTLIELENLKNEYGGIAIYKLVNIAIRNALISEGIIKE